MTIGPQPICMWCRRYRPEVETGMTCDAFPDGIPDAIIMNDFDHRQPYPGDGGLMFFPERPGDPPAEDDPFLSPVVAVPAPE